MTTKSAGLPATGLPGCEPAADGAAPLRHLNPVKPGTIRIRQIVDAPVRVQSPTTPCRAICSGRLSGGTDFAQQRTRGQKPRSQRRRTRRRCRPAPPRQTTTSEASSEDPAQTLQNPAATNRPGLPQPADPLQHRCWPLRGAQSSPSRTGAALPPGRLLRASKTRSNSPARWSSPSPQGGGKTAGANGGHPSPLRRALLRRTDQAGLQRALAINSKPPPQGALLSRDITWVLTLGTVLEEGMLSARRNNWLAAVVVEPAQASNCCAGAWPAPT